MNEEITKEQLLANIEVFLGERKESIDTGWPEVTNEEWQQLEYIIRSLIYLKYEEDIDGDLPFDWELVDRTRYYHPFLNYCKMEYPHKLKSLGQYINQLRQAETILSVAQHEVEKNVNYIFALVNQDEKLKNLIINKRD